MFLDGIPILTLTTFLPLVGVLFILLIRGDGAAAVANARAVALITALATFALTIMLYMNFNLSNPAFQFVEFSPWIPHLNIGYHMGIDGMSLIFIMLTGLLGVLCILGTFGMDMIRPKEYLIAFLVLETFIIGVFCALDIIIFYVFFEAVLIPMYLIIGIWGGERRVYAAYKFFLYTLLGSVLMLIAVIVMYLEVGSTNIITMLGHDFPVQMQTWLWWAFLASFAVKIPMWPFHTWLPDAHVEAPTGGSVILAGILLKLGGYGLIRFSLPMFPEACMQFANVIFVLSIIAVIYTSLVALAQEDMKKLIAYSSVAHMGFVTLGAFTFSEMGIQGAIFQMVSHGLISGALFFIVGVIYDRQHTRLISHYGGLVHRMKNYAVVFMIVMLGSIGLPATSGFVGEIFVIIAAFQVEWWWALGAALGMILGAAYMLYLYRRVVFGKMTNDALRSIQDLTTREKLVFAPLVALILFLGIYPFPALQLTELSAKNVVARYDMPAETPLIPTAMDLNLQEDSDDHNL
ncbi:MAG: NADH-quinone oxidoreductase subunit M [Alphaproteobacteria bacterium]